MHIHHSVNPADFIIVFSAVVMITGYLYLAGRKKWPVYRSVLWIVGIIFAVLVMVGPFAEEMHHNFIYHMYGHLLLGMLSPLLLVLAMPLRLLLGTLPVKSGRRLSRFMNSTYIRFIAHPVTATILNTGGLWLLYRTDLFMMMHHHTWLHYLIHFHIFLAGYLFTAVMLELDPVRHPYSFKYRAIVMMVSVALHQILSKSFYPYPPAGVDAVQAQTGAVVMYYGGDVIELLIIFIMCLGWYRSVRPGKVSHA
ncbi:cytochrome c oxidase assembly protein [Macrococcus brunensis]|uniref:Cytochrome c oxidase assembly protein n=1 Tax=Macrococcus brunensis TaxID=198483 RepID=A0A4R6BF98_9STAP|nr:cytochrome c oxidase assembly protein [Macrococcus brunensis]TDL98531.1 cytochrome c oxidase assembly protein [Macrococcus brunensis]ULG73029.1 cytochrome c oxidase assembly protein [Macrococcus brunensis]